VTEKDSLDENADGRGAEPRTGPPFSAREDVERTAGQPAGKHAPEKPVGAEPSSMPARNEIPLDDWPIARIGAATEAHGDAQPAPGARPQPLFAPNFEPRREGQTTRASDFDRRKRVVLRWLVEGARFAGYTAAGYLALVLLLIVVYRIVDPPGSTLMMFRWIGGAGIDRTWTPLEKISPHLVRAVVVAEDGRFCDHWGIDLEAMGEAIERAVDGIPRGASTISMQVVKNMFLWPSKSFLRKAIELPLTVVMELAWPKWRILEVYLNVAEWGPGVFGAEAAAHYHFNKSAAKLSEREAALLAASLPNPVRRDAGDPGPRTARKAAVIQARMHAAGPVALCVTERQ
jgi:monofunctional biosynthetic peptidoglycan transglycosylase